MYLTSINIVLDMERSVADAKERFARRGGGRVAPRMDPRVREAIRQGLGGFDRPNLSALRRALVKRCREWEIPAASRTTLYEMVERELIHKYEVRNLPRHVQSTLYNVDREATIGGHQLAFYCFNHGNLPALSFGASLPWIDLAQAVRMSGFRPKSKALLEAVLSERG